MYCNKENVNILTSLLLRHSVKHAVVCPGSRNAAIVHNLNETHQIECHPVTDERSAGFYALGLSLSCDFQPVAVCVTSGTALLNMAPAVAEAHYRHIPLIIISADRPPQWIDQLDGQTLPQTDALGRFVAKSVSLPEPATDEERWYCARMINEAMLETVKNGGCPVHINVPITEPLFQFDVAELPDVTPVSYAEADGFGTLYQWLLSLIGLTRKAMVVIGQTHCLPDYCGIEEGIANLQKVAVVVNESLSHPVDGICHVDEALCAIEGREEEYFPNMIIYVGDTVVSKRLRKFLRRSKAKETWVVTPDGELHDVTMSATHVLKATPEEFIKNMPVVDSHVKHDRSFVARWNELLADIARKSMLYEPPYSQMATVKYFEEQLEDMDYYYHVHYANSSAVRLANIFADHYVYCNRGVNGIEGSLSTAAGHSLGTDGKVFCVIGDLSFFYDQNALWNKCLRGNLRILLLNNGGGSIFRTLPGLSESPVAEPMVAAQHATTAQGICTQNDIGYLKASTMLDMQLGVVRLLTAETTRPMLLEVFTDGAEDTRVLQEYYSWNLP